MASSVPHTTRLFNAVIKRDGSREPFAPQRLQEAIAKAGAATGEFDDQQAAQLARRVLVLAVAMDWEEPTVEGLQDLVEDVLMASPYRQAARAYILYREQHRILRELQTTERTALVDGYLDRSDWQVAENANMAYSLQGLNNHISSEVTRKYWLEKLYPEQVRKAHESGDFHIHDLNLLAVYCVGWDLADLLRQGFRGASGKAESRPARHFRTALGQMANFFYTLQGEAAGAQAFSSIDTLLAPFIAHDGLSYDEVKQALQEWVFNLNVATRVGFQTPFTNITLDFNVPRRLANEPVVIGGELQEAVYGDFQKEMDIFNRAFLEVMIEGDARGRVFTFPIPTYNVDADFDYDDPRFEPLWEATARYGIPYFANFVNSEMSPDDARSMCCRLRLDTRELQHRGGGLFGANPLTGSIGVVTLNLPRLGHLATDQEDFRRRLLALMDVARDSLVIKRKTLEGFTESGLYPYARHYLKSIRERFGSYWHNHFSTIGIIGLEEAARNLLGEGLEESQGRAFGLSVLEMIRERLAEYQKETGTPFNLEATPAEGAGYRLLRLDREHLPEMPVFQERPDLVYSNSSLPPVEAHDDPFELLEQQDDFQAMYTGGTVVHFFLGERVEDPAAVKSFVRNVCANYRLPYFTLSPTFSICPEHGYLAGEQAECATCGEATEVYSRVVGYLRPVKQWNPGKKKEFGRRGLYDGGMS
ncbi:ribonucleoside triphosphate reductase [bacterium DOLZORAL124_64_63]|nr:MAG: ribonucleoside triphosphate reductase [bacterium DOLZORAL124_64_63]